MRTMKKAQKSNKGREELLKQQHSSLSIALRA